MPVSATGTARQLYKEDLSLATAPNPATVNENVLGPSGSVVTPLTPIDALILSNLIQAASDVAAAAAAVNVGQLYWNTSDSSIHTRLT